MVPVGTVWGEHAVLSVPALHELRGRVGRRHGMLNHWLHVDEKPHRIASGTGYRLRRLTLLHAGLDRQAVRADETVKV